MTLLILHLAATLFMTGLGWFVQVVHYPLLHRVGVGGFHNYESEHKRRTSPVVAPVMLFELASGIWLVLAPPEGVEVALLLAGVALLAVVWGSTFVLQVPLHRDLERGFAAHVVDRLVATNWIRTVAWSLRAVLLMFVVHALLTTAGVPEATEAPQTPAPTLPPVQGVLLK